ncbi:ATP-dependent Clp protease proteolytic subunit 4, chloroplastic [Selaginella moellendorffii]|uniref:ATP-dependent Clp protease proteolytic subunit 4, chloroplastic n=1 Tax=Selaginella moellendorffii TaxID=88036 RepID=UPI000D1CA714|nr:ATP-dependent Clp protease proteolytic subunit 4, chloroplastic [Selaginella moellendorffii]|eukprot:XP_002981945.2 ATP-dependent Clp protease proteolytic subunit 4, chloroplastic [Selaginella moellendorffii]
MAARAASMALSAAACASSPIHSFDQPLRATSISRRSRLPLTVRAAARSSASALGISMAPLDFVHGDTSGAVASTAAPPGQKSAEADVMGLLLRQRTVFLGHQLDDFVADAIISQLLLLDAMDSKKEIRMFINCPGGSVSAAMGIYDAIQLCRAEVSTIAFGLAASTASVILAGGTKGKRFAMPNTRIMVHQPMGGASGQAIDVEIQAKEIMFHKNNFTRILAEITGKPFEQVEKDIDRDRYMSAVEAMEYGLIDGVIDQENIIPVPAMPEKKIERRRDIKDAEADPMKFLKPQIPDDEIF